MTSTITQYGWERWRKAGNPKAWTKAHATIDGWVTACGLGISPYSREAVADPGDQACSTCGESIVGGWPGRWDR